MKNIVAFIFGSSPVTSIIGYVVGLAGTLFEFYNNGGKLTTTSVVLLGIMALGRTAKDGNK